MSSQQKSMLGQAHGNLEACLRLLRERAGRGSKSRPTVAELNELLNWLANAKTAVECVVALG